MEVFAESEKLQSESLVPVDGQCNSVIVASSASLINEINENNESNSHELFLSVYNPNAGEVDTVNHNSKELVEVPVAVTEIHDTHSLDSEIQDNHFNDKRICALRSWEDGYNWRKYGQKHIKGNEYPRSYYRCSHPNCQVKKLVEQSHDGRISDVIYRGNHDHPKPQSVGYTTTCTNSSIQGERSDNFAISRNTKDELLSNENGEKQSCVPNLRNKPNGNRQPSLTVASDESGGGSQVSKIQNNDGDHALTIKLVSESVANSGTCSESLEANPALCEADETNPSVEVGSTSNALVFVGDSHQTQGGDDIGGVREMQIDDKGTCPLVTAVDRFSGDGYNWRKYGQKQIKGSDIPRSYYRCTHPNCLVKKQLECSPDGQVTDIVYKGEHNHPKPLPSSHTHISVGRLLAIQEGVDNLSSINHTYVKLTTGQTNHDTEQKGNNPVQAEEVDVNGEVSTLKRTYDKFEQNTELDTKPNHLTVGDEVSRGGMTNQQCKLFVEMQGQSQLELESLLNEKDKVLATTPTSLKNTLGSALSPQQVKPISVSNSPVYMVTSRGIVPVEVESEEKRSSDADDKGLSVSMTEKLLENAYHWRKYGQKNIKGSEFPRSYYRCTHTHCQVKMQLERSHDGRIIEIIYKGKHDHPKPQPITRMAIGAILSLEENNGGDKSSNGRVQTSGSNRIPNLSIFTKNIEDDMDPESKRRKIEMGGGDVTPLSRTPREPRVVVETLSEVDVVDDGYRWQKYGRKIVKGNSHPRNYYRCSNGGCTVKKHVERAASNPKAVITTYEGKHNHELPPPRITTHDTGGILINTNTPSSSSSSLFGRELVVDNQDSKEEIIDAEPVQTQPIAAPVAKEEKDGSDIIHQQSLEHEGKEL